jgi:hypothetical protein
MDSKQKLPSPVIAVFLFYYACTKVLLTGRKELDHLPKQKFHSGTQLYLTDFNIY